VHCFEGFPENIVESTLRAELTPSLPSKKSERSYSTESANNGYSAQSKTAALKDAAVCTIQPLFPLEMVD
jgi:hypothetical protein